MSAEHRLVLRPDGHYIKLYCLGCPNQKLPRVVASFKDREGAIPADEVLVKMQRHLAGEGLGMPYACGAMGCTCLACEPANA